MGMFMMKQMKMLVLTVLFLSVALSGGAEYYQYRDADGNDRFTDNIADIPPDQRPDITTHQSIEPDPYQEETTLDQNAEERQSADQEAADEAMETDRNRAGASEERDGGKDALTAQRDELRKEFEALQEERKAIGPPPSPKANNAVKNEYNRKITKLNSKIEDYDRRTKAFDEKVKAYNSQVGKK